MFGRHSMISAIRNKFGSRLLDFFIWLAIITFVLLYLIPGGKNAKRSEEWVISVNNEKISFEEYAQMLENRRKIGTKQDFESNRQREEVYKKETLEALTDMLLVQSLEKDLNIELKPEIIRAKLEKILPDLINQDGTINIELLKAKLQQDGRSMAEIAMLEEQIASIDKQIANELKNEVINNLQIGSLYIPQYALQNSYRAEYALKQFSILTTHSHKHQDEINKIKVNDVALNNFFEQENQATKRYWSTSHRSGDVWSFTPENFGIKVTEKQIKTYYERNRKEEFVKEKPQLQIRRILFAVDKTTDADGQKTASARELAGKVRAELANEPTKFEELAKKYSDDKTSANQGGLLDFFGEDGQEKNLSTIAFELRADGEISEIFETSKGLEIIQRVAKKKIEFKSLEEVKGEIEQKIVSQQFEKLFPINARRIIAESAKNPQALANFITAKKGTKKSLNNVVIGQENKDSAAITKLFELKKNGLKAFIVRPNLGEIVVLTNIDEAAALDFEKIKPTVLADYKKHLIVDAIQNKLKKAYELLANGKSPKIVAHELGLDYEQTGHISRETIEKHPHLHKKPVVTNLLWSLRNIGATKIEVAEQDGMHVGYLVKMDDMAQVAKVDLESKKKHIMYALFNQYRLSLDSSFIASLRKNGTISLNTTIINA
jgi:parvulin-like peptidyl-prolyl isomerase